MNVLPRKRLASPLHGTFVSLSLINLIWHIFTVWPTFYPYLANVALRAPSNNLGVACLFMEMQSCIVSRSNVYLMPKDASKSLDMVQD